MSKKDILYVKSRSFSETDEDDVENIWDDSKLNNAYDKALGIANAEVARRVAMSTNSAQTTDDTAKTKVKNHKNTKWKVGTHCRAVYDQDGIEYEAVLLRIVNDKECVIRFLGYGNTELLPLNDLKPSLGHKERTKQIQESIADKMKESSNEMDCSERPTSPGSNVSVQGKKKLSKKKNKPKQTNNFDFPDIPMPNLAQFRHLSPIDVPPPLLHSAQGSEDQALSSMLLSWYMSGYYTGLYQGMKRSHEGRKN